MRDSARHARAHDGKPRASRAGRTGDLGRSGSRHRARPPAARDRRPVGTRPTADGIHVRPLRHGLQWRNLQPSRTARGNRARGSRTGVAWPLRQRGADRGDRRVGVEATLRRATGMFAIALWNRESRVLTLARDRIGEKPLYYGRIGDALVFASELKRCAAIRASTARSIVTHCACTCASRACPRRTRSIVAFASCRPARISSSSMRATRRACGRTERSIRRSRTVVRSRSRNNADGPSASSTRSCAKAVARRMEADVPLGAFLSGGIDSSTIVALMQAQSSTPVDTFTIGFHEAGYDEAGYAKAVARHLGTRIPKRTIRHGRPRARRRAEAAVDLRRTVLRCVADPDLSRVELTRRHVKVSLSGDGGDELFGGYTRYF